MGQFRSACLTRRSVLQTLGAAPLALTVAAQEPIIRVDVQLVRHLVTVKSPEGKPIADLAQGDFTVLDGGVAQQIALFERSTAQPLSVAVLIDASGSTSKEDRYATDAVRRFLRAILGEGNPKDSVSLYSFNWQISQLVGYTRNLSRLEGSLRRINFEAGTSMYDAIYFAAQDLEGREGRRVMVLVTDGADTVSSKSYHDALRAAHRSDSVLYSVLVMPIMNPAGRSVGGENALTTLAAETGGRRFSPGTPALLDKAFADILRDLRTQYLIGYYPKNAPAAGNGFHRVQVQVARPGVQVLTRTGYYSE